MRYPGPLVEGRFVRRYQRFLADFCLPDGSVVTAHCANPGSMLTCLEAGSLGWLTQAHTPRRRLSYTWQVATVGTTRIFVNPALANAVVAEAVRRGRVPELAGYDEVDREVRFGAHTRFDLCLRRGKERCFVEIKSATLRLGAGLAGFPDAVTARGTRHLAALEAVVRGGDRAVQLFFVARADARAVSPADRIDPEYGAALRRALGAGVEVIAYRASISKRAVTLGARVPVRISAPPAPLAPRC